MDGGNKSGLALVLLGLVIAAGAAYWFYGRGLGLSFGHLPGDITMKTGHGELYVPVATCLLLSGLVSLIVWIFNNLFR